MRLAWIALPENDRQKSHCQKIIDRNRIARKLLTEIALPENYWQKSYCQKMIDRNRIVRKWMTEIALPENDYQKFHWQKLDCQKIIDRNRIARKLLTKIWLTETALPEIILSRHCPRDTNCHGIGKMFHDWSLRRKIAMIKKHFPVNEWQNTMETNSLLQGATKTIPLHHSHKNKWYYLPFRSYTRFQP